MNLNPQIMIYIACAGDAPLHVSSALLGYITSFEGTGNLEVDLGGEY